MLAGPYTDVSTGCRAGSAVGCVGRNCGRRALRLHGSAFAFLGQGMIGRGRKFVAGELQLAQLERIALFASHVTMSPALAPSASDHGSVRFTSNDTGLEFWTISAHLASDQSFSIHTKPGLAISMTLLGRMEGIEVASGKILSQEGKIGALVVPTTEPAQTFAQIKAGSFLNARLWVNLNWLEQTAEGDARIEQLIRIAQDHLALKRLVASPRMIAAARAAATRQAPDGGLSRLHLECCAHEILLEALDQLCSPHASPADAWERALTPQRAERMEKARSILLDRLGDPPSLSELARAVGTNVRRLKQDFPAMYGKAVHAYVRERRLEAAAALLANGRCTVGQAAHAAGYVYQANFATEFRQYFGVPPRMFLKRYAR
jgi:AraC-like DNA-binding protein